MAQVRDMSGRWSKGGDKGFLEGSVSSLFSSYCIGSSIVSPVYRACCGRRQHAVVAVWW